MYLSFMSLRIEQKNNGNNFECTLKILQEWESLIEKHMQNMVEQKFEKAVQYYDNKEEYKNFNWETLCDILKRHNWSFMVVANLG